MNKYQAVSRTAPVVGLLLASFALAPTAANAQDASAYDGIYIGRFNGKSSAGDFALMAKSGVGIVITYDGPSQDATVDINVPIAADGSFRDPSFAGEPGNVISGNFTFTGVSGAYSDSEGDSGTLSGQRKADAGTFSSIAGYYVGTVDGPSACIGNGQVRSILAADGRLTFVAFDVAFEDEPAAGLFVTLGNNGTVNGTTTTGAAFSGKFNLPAPTAAGSWSTPDGCSGTWQMSRQVAAVARPDSDRDGIPNVADNCPNAANPGQDDADDDGVGDACDSVDVSKSLVPMITSIILDD